MYNLLLIIDPERAAMLIKNGKQLPPFDLSLGSAQLDMNLLQQQFIRGHSWADDPRRRPPFEGLQFVILISHKVQWADLCHVMLCMSWTLLLLI